MKRLESILLIAGLTLLSLSFASWFWDFFILDLGCILNSECEAEEVVDKMAIAQGHEQVRTGMIIAAVPLLLGGQILRLKRRA